jgi:hypothetical protein
MKRTTCANARRWVIPEAVPLVQGVDLISPPLNAHNVADAGSQGNGRMPNFSLGNGSNHGRALSYCPNLPFGYPGFHK